MKRLYLIKFLSVLILLLFLFMDMPGSAYFIIFIFLHELTHCTAAVLLGYRIRLIEVLPFGMSMALKEEFIKPYDDIIISLSGPLMNLAFFILFHILYMKGYDKLSFIRDANLFLCIFNLIPAGFLDGGNILKVLLKSWVSFYAAYIITNLNGMIFGGIIILVALFDGFSFKNIILICLGIFFVFKSCLEKKNITINVIKDAINKQDYIYMKKNIPVCIKIFKKGTKLTEIIKMLCFNRYYIVYSFEEGKPQDRFYETDLIKLYCLYGNISIDECAKYSDTRRN